MPALDQCDEKGEGADTSDADRGGETDSVEGEVIENAEDAISSRPSGEESLAKPPTKEVAKEGAEKDATGYHATTTTTPCDADVSKPGQPSGSASARSAANEPSGIFVINEPVAGQSEDGQSAAAEQKVFLPAILLAFMAGLLLLLSVFNGLQRLIALQAGVGLDDNQAVLERLQTTPLQLTQINATVCFLFVVINLTILVGAVQMIRLRSRGLAILASVLAVIPCFGCCFVGVPLGVWAMVVLADPNVRASFR